MTVEEAKEKECCQFESKCMGEQCMAWRWNYEAMVIGETISGEKIFANGKRLISETDGYCGLIAQDVRESGEVS